MHLVMCWINVVSYNQRATLEFVAFVCGVCLWRVCEACVYDVCMGRVLVACVCGVYVCGVYV